MCRVGGVSARDAFLGRKPNARRDLRCAFGDYVMATAPNTDSILKVRTEDCVVMLPTGNRTGSVRMLSLGTGRIVTRDQFKILPMPNSVIDRLNGLAAQDGRVLQRKDGRARYPRLHDPPHPPRVNQHRHPLPDLMIAPPHLGIDPAIAIQDVQHIPHAELADEIGLPQPDHAMGVGVYRTHLLMRKTPTYIFKLTHPSTTSSQRWLIRRMGVTKRMGVTRRTKATRRMGVMAMRETT